MKRVVPCLLLVLAACPKRGGGGGSGGTGPVAQPGAGCPPASGVHIASYLAPVDGAQGQGRTGWVLPLHNQVVDSLEGTPEYATIDAAAATAAGVPAPPHALWMLMPNSPPCKAAIGDYYAAAIDAPTKNIAYGVELSGCAAPQDVSDASAIALVSDAIPSECQIVPPRPVAARLGEYDKQGVWQRPTKATAIPPAFARVVPAKECVAPACETLWSVAQIEIGGRSVAWAGAVNWLTIPADQPDPCAWTSERFSGFFVEGADGTPVKVTEGQHHPLLLSAVLADKTGPRVLLAAGPGEYTAYDLVDGQAKARRNLVWLIPHPDSYAAIDNLGPECAPAATP